VSSVRIDVGAGDGGPVREELARDAPADVAARAGDERVASFEELVDDDPRRLGRRRQPRLTQRRILKRADRRSQAFLEPHGPWKYSPPNQAVNPG